MSWLRVEGRAPQHRKIAPLSDAAFRLHFTAKCWCAEELTDGVMPASVPATLTAAPRGKALAKAVNELVSAGLWDINPDGGWRVHDYLEYNPSAESVRAKQQQARDRMQRSRSLNVRANIPRSAREVRDVFAPSVSGSLPDPRSDLTCNLSSEDLSGSARVSRETPEEREVLQASERSEFQKFERSFVAPPRSVEVWDGPTPEHEHQALVQRVDVTEEAETFRLDARGKGRMASDWDAEFSLWLRRGARMRQERAERFGKAPGLVAHEQTQVTERGKAAIARGKAAIAALDAERAKGPALAFGGGSEPPAAEERPSGIQRVSGRPAAGKVAS